MKYVLKQPNTWTRWAILDDRGTEICDGPPEQLEIGQLMCNLLNVHAEQDPSAVVTLTFKGGPKPGGTITR